MMMRKAQVVTIIALSVFVIGADDFQRINVNSASREQLKVLPGVGDKLAQRIVAHRKEKGLFSSLDEMLLVQGMSPKLLQEISDKTEFSKAKAKSAQIQLKPLVKDSSQKDLEQEIAAKLSQFEKEPKAREIQEEALRYAMADPARIDGWLNRARVAPSLPSLSVSAGRGTDYDATVREKLGDSSVYSKKDSSDLNLNVKVEWKFADLIFNQNELRVARESFRMSVIRERILTDVTKAYMERKRAQLKSVNKDAIGALEMAEIGLRVEELTAVLDGLTGGWFSEKIARL